jgi:hypothetical protein
MKRSFKRASIVAGGVGSIVAIGVASFAFFTAATSVTATGETATTKAVVVTDATVGALRPGSCEDVTFTLQNPNDYLLTGISGVNSVAVRANGNTASHLHIAPYLHAGSTVADLINGGGYTFEGIPAGGQKTVVLKNAVCMDLGASDADQGQAVAMDLNLIVKAAQGGEYTSIN